MSKTIEFHNTPGLTREIVNNWLIHARKDKAAPAQIAVLEDVLKLIDVALTVLEPGPAAPEKKETILIPKAYGKRITDYPDRKGL